MSDSSAAGGAKSQSFGLWSLVSGLVAIFGVLMIGQASFGWVAGFDPVDWLRIVTGWMIPVGTVAALVLGVLSIIRRSGRNLGLVGIALAVITVATFAGYLVTHPY